MLSTNVSIEQKINLSEFEKAGINVYIKRDDKIHPFISGNKWRKLKYNYEAFLNSGCKGIVTYGGAFSNHILATAAFCAENKIKCVGIIRGEAPKILNHILIMAKLWGMSLEFLSRADYQNRNLETERWLEQGYFIIPEGGNNEAGVRGCSEIIQELTREYHHIVCASGTGCTIAGIVKGTCIHNLKTQCHSIPVLKPGDFIMDRVKDYVSDANNLSVHTNFHFGGYAKTSSELLNFMNYFAKETGILTDPIYTAKLLFGVVKLAESNFFKKGQEILVIHTGGLTGLLSEKMLSAVQKTII